MSKTIGQIARELILANPTLKNAELLELVKTNPAFPENGKTTVACIAWYKNDLRKKGITSLPGVEEPVRTVAMIEAEIIELQAELQMRKEEEAAAEKASYEENVEKLKRLAEMLGVELPNLTLQ